MAVIVNRKEKDDKTFIAKVSNYGVKKSGRKHIEVPKEKRKLFKSGHHVRVTEI
jgi:hypothetical protein